MAALFQPPCAPNRVTTQNKPPSEVPLSLTVFHHARTRTPRSKSGECFVVYSCVRKGVRSYLRVPSRPAPCPRRRCRTRSPGGGAPRSAAAPSLPPAEPAAPRAAAPPRSPPRSSSSVCTVNPHFQIKDRSPFTEGCLCSVVLCLLQMHCGE